ncbi:unnamed protein product [Urochloa humidicola]
MGLLILVFLFMLPGATSYANAAGGCNRRCNETVIPYPFGFAGDCPILLACNATISTAALIPHRHSAAAVPYNVSSVNSTTSTFVTYLGPSCNRSVLDAKALLRASPAGRLYGPPYLVLVS